MSKEPKKKPFETKKQYERRVRTEAKVEGYVHQDLKRVKKPRETYRDKCGHCSGFKVMRNGKDCDNCGGQGYITRFR